MHPGFRTFKLNDKGRVTVRDIAVDFSNLLDAMKSYGVDGRELSLVQTKLEEACFFAKKSIAMKAENQE